MSIPVSKVREMNEKVEKKVIKGTEELKLSKGGDDSNLQKSKNYLMGPDSARQAEYDTGQIQLKS